MLNHKFTAREAGVILVLVAAILGYFYYYVVYQYFEDPEGTYIGLVTIDSGRFMWIPDEDFPLFLKSLYACAKQIVAEDDEKKHIDRSEDAEMLADITYLIVHLFRRKSRENPDHPEKTIIQL